MCGPTNPEYDPDPGKGSSTDDPGKANCELCDLGKYGLGNKCNECGVGMYNNDKGKLVCKPCPIDTYSNEEGKASPADCTRCPEFTSTGTLTGLTDSSLCVCEEGTYKDKVTSACVTCPKPETNCTGLVGLTMFTLPAAAGYYRESNKTVDFFSCDTPEDCRGGLMNEQCIDGHVGVLCAVCAPLHVRIGGVCSKCGENIIPDGTTGLATAGTVPPFLLFLCLLYHFGKKEVVEEDEEEKSNTKKTSTKNTKIVPTLNKSSDKSSTLEKEYQNTSAGPTKIVTINNSSDKSSKLDTIASRGGRSGRGARGGARGGRGGRGGKRPPQEKEYQNTSAGPTTSAKLNTSTTSSSKMTTPEEDEAAAAKHEFYQSAAASTAALKIQSMFYKSRGKSNDLATRHKRHKAEVALALAQTLRGGGLVPDVLEEIQDGIQDGIDGAVEGETATATGDTAGDEVEADTGNIDVVNLPGMNLKMGSIGNKFRILIGWLQITAALVISFDVPWPPVTLNLFKGLTFINFNFMDFFAPLDPCALYTPFLKQAAFHMSILPLCILMVLPAAILAMSCQKARVVKERAGHMLVTIIFLLYPGIVTRVFTTLKCKQIGEKSYLVADYSVVCWEGEHTEYATAMAFFSIIYVVGIPLGTSVLLHCNRKLLHPDEIDPENTALRLKAESFGQVYGSLYEAYDPEYYWFETLSKWCSFLLFVLFSLGIINKYF